MMISDPDLFILCIRLRRNKTTIALNWIKQILKMIHNNVEPSRNPCKLFTNILWKCRNFKAACRYNVRNVLLVWHNAASHKSPIIKQCWFVTTSNSGNNHSETFIYDACSDYHWFVPCFTARWSNRVLAYFYTLLERKC